MWWRLGRVGCWCLIHGCNQLDDALYDHDDAPQEGAASSALSLGIATFRIMLYDWSPMLSCPFLFLIPPRA